MDAQDEMRAGPISVVRLFERQVARTPEAEAVRFEGRALTYGELNRRANGLAALLRKHGVGRGDRVAIGLERSIEVAIAVLAALKAGAGYVPLDPAYPRARLSYMVENSSPRVLVTQRSLASIFPAPPVVLLVDELDRLDGENPDVPVGDDDLAYVIYTSGSTGNPKGVAMPHGPLARLVQWQLTESRLEPGARTLQFAPLSFDVHFQELFGSWAAGGCVVVVPEALRVDASRLLELLEKEKVARLFLPFVALQSLCETAEAHGRFPSGLREVVTAGEQLRISNQIRAFFRQLPDCRLFNHYGPSETHVVTSHPLPADVERWPPLPPIGKAIPSAITYVLDAELRPVPPGQEGELYIGGECLALGYLNRPELTAERFLPDPFSDRAGARMYRTGDLVRVGENDDLEFLGRIDGQVKIRGYRIEVGEIEVALGTHPEVRQVAVVAREDVPGDKRLVAYYVSPDARSELSAELRRHLEARLPAYMVPTAFVRVPELPRTPSGKIDRRALPKPVVERSALGLPYVPPRAGRETELARLFAELLQIDAIGAEDNLFELGLNSILSQQAVARIRKELGLDVPVIRLFEHPTVAKLCASLEPATARARRRKRQSEAGGAIAIVGMSGRFPGAADVDTLWRNLCAGLESITFFDESELDPLVPADLRKDPRYVRARGVLPDADKFDAAFFGINPREAALIDPQQRLLLELAWEALEHAGHPPRRCEGAVGVFAGTHNNTYFPINLAPRPEITNGPGAFSVMVGNEKDYVATRVAHRLGLAGPAISIHTACSTSLVAVCQAVLALRSGQCDIALAGGASLTIPQRSGHLYQEGAMLSPDGHTRAFDAQANGTVFSDGAGMVVLRRLEDALEDGDTIYAVIRGIGLNNDGSEKASFTAPSVEGQAGAITMAQEDADVDPSTIGYVEAHGTATPLGDPIEVEALTRAFREKTQARGYCALGSIKSNIGHLTAAAGVAGLIKAALTLHHETIPPSLHFERPNPAIDFESSPFFVNAALRPWRRSDRPRRAAVSSFGVGGTNAHVVLEEAPLLPPTEPARGPQVLVLSARSAPALSRMASALAARLETEPSTNLADAAWTLNVGREAFPHRIAVVADDAASAAAILRSEETAAAIARTRPAQPSEVVFMFPGQGSQYAGMGRELYALEPEFREAFDACAEGAKAELGLDLRDVVFHGDAEALLPTAIMQPAIFAIEYSLARLWMSLGVTPSAMLGHSIGEFAAAALAGIFSLPDALRLVARRGRLMQEQPAGSMLSVRMPFEELRTRIPDELSIAAENSPTASVVSGPTPIVEAFRQRLEKEGVPCRPLFTSHAFHSAMMDPVVDAFRKEVAAVPRSAPEMRVLSTATADWIDEATATSPDYWATHLRRPVRFSAAILKAIDSPARVLLEVGSRTTLAALSRQHPQLAKADKTAVSSLADDPAIEVREFRKAAGQLWAHGVSIDLTRFDRRSSRRRIPLPTYAFERQRHWIDAPATAAPIVSSAVESAPVAAHANGANGAHAPAAQADGGAAPDRRTALVAKLRSVFENAAGIDVSDSTRSFIELGFDSLILTQIALQLGKTFGVKVTFRQLMSDCSTLDRLAAMLEPHLPASEAAAAPASAAASTPATPPAPVPAAAPTPASAASSSDLLQRILDLQLQMAARLELLLRNQSEGNSELARLLQQQADAGALLARAAAGSGRTRSGGSSAIVLDASHPIRPGARLGRTPNGEPAWFVPDPNRVGRFLKVVG